MDFATLSLSFFIDDHRVLLVGDGSVLHPQPAPTLPPPTTPLALPLAEAIATIMGGPCRVINIISLLHGYEGLYDILRDDVLTDPELSFLAGRISIYDLALSWSIRENLIFFDGRLDIAASSARFHHVLAPSHRMARRLCFVRLRWVSAAFLGMSHVFHMVLFFFRSYLLRAL